MELGLKDKSVIVLASSKGLGKASALEFAKEGANVMLASRNLEELTVAASEVEKETGIKLNVQVCDVTKPEDIKNLVKTTADLYGTVDVLVNNAGGPPAGGFDAFEDDQWQYAFELNLLSFIRAIREVLPYMRKQGGGRIVNIASSSIKEPVDGLILSNTFRTGIVGLSKSLAKELGSDQILINTVGPGRIGTDRVAELDQIRADKLNLSYEEGKKQMEQAIPIGRYGTPAEFAKMIVFLGSFANTYVTGQSLVVDGGATKSF
ncbi:SDR family oxidoreductase [Bacillus sp. FJAT-45037]|uniref:SDR family oxidoreductase n=1 Tax=Bacillus sp. FJAT-45037 TaxID=2011007 RepID=UPI000C247B2D|nr:SDR family oxidoreductase [Bacillus sp. FJAT-45037]